MTIRDVLFGVANYLPPEEESVDMFLTDGRITQQVDKLAHWVWGVISLRETGRVRVKLETDEIFTTTPGEHCVLTFDNDCKEERKGRNDMDMFYQLIQDVDTASKRQFRVFGRKKEEVASPAAALQKADLEANLESLRLAHNLIKLIARILSGPEARLLEGKPCLSAQIKESNVLPPI